MARDEALVIADEPLPADGKGAIACALGNPGLEQEGEGPSSGAEEDEFAFTCSMALLAIFLALSVQLPSDARRRSRISVWRSNLNPSREPR